MYFCSLSPGVRLLFPFTLTLFFLLSFFVFHLCRYLAHALMRNDIIFSSSSDFILCPSLFPIRPWPRLLIFSPDSLSLAGARGASQARQHGHCAGESGMGCCSKKQKNAGISFHHIPPPDCSRLSVSTHLFSCCTLLSFWKSPR